MKDGGGLTVTRDGCESTGPGTGDECIPIKTWCTVCFNGTCKKTVTKSSSAIILLKPRK